MALDSGTLATGIVSDVLADLYDGGEGLNEAQLAGIEKIIGIIAFHVVAHIKNNAVVTVAKGIKVKTTGSASAQTGATDETGTGTIT